MPLLEVLALSVGPAIAKAILKSWLKDSDIASNTTASLIDLISSKTNDVLARQRTHRQFEEIGEKVVENLLPVFREAGLDESSLEAIGLAVASTIGSVPLDVKILLQKDLDPSHLTQHFLNSSLEATRLFTESETVLYERVISESANYIIDISSQFPSFTERTFAEVLLRERELVLITNQILTEVRQIREQSQQANPDIASARFEESYRRAVIRTLDELELFGVDVTGANRRHRLSIAYVTLVVQQKQSGILSQHSTEGESSEKEDDNLDSEVSVDADEALSKSRRLIVRGPAGSGKTTLLQWLAVHSAAQSFKSALEDWNTTVPFFIRLRQFAESGLPAPEDFPRMLVPSIAGTMPVGWVHKQLESGRGVILVDGVDEVTQLQRIDVRNWLRQLSLTFDKARIVVSSRPHAIAERWMELEGFSEADLQPMGLGDIDEFIDHWHQAVREELKESLELAELGDFASHLKGALRQNRSIRNLATNPLFCAMICALHRDRRKQLPSDRIELYEACIRMLLEARDVERRVPLADYPNLSYREKRTILEDLAYWMLTNNWTTVTIEAADARLDLKLKGMIRMQDIKCENVRRFFVERSGMLREPITGQLDFPHRTFQEFLAAKAALDEGDIGVLVTNASNDQWHEVIVLAAGLASKKQREQLITDLIKRGDKEPSHRHQLHLLAVACLETATDLDQSVQREVKSRLAELLPPRNVTEARDWASAGELAIPFLSYSQKHYVKVSASCIRALAFIGGETALEALKSYAVDYRVMTLKELMRASESFEEEDYVRSVLEAVEVRHLVMGGVTSLIGISHFKHLENLSIYGYPIIRDISPLAKLVNLIHLAIYDSTIFDFSPLENLSELSHLTIRNSWIAYSHRDKFLDLNTFSKFKNLKFLYLGGFAGLQNFEALSQSTNLQEVWLQNIESQIDLEPLINSKSLKKIRFIGEIKRNKLPKELEALLK